MAIAFVVACFAGVPNGNIPTTTETHVPVIEVFGGV